MTIPDLSFTILFLYTDPATPEIYTLSLHDALPISAKPAPRHAPVLRRGSGAPPHARHPIAPARRSCAAVAGAAWIDRKSTRLNSSHRCISYAVFCLKKKKKKNKE